MLVEIEFHTCVFHCLTSVVTGFFDDAAINDVERSCEETVPLQIIPSDGVGPGCHFIGLSGDGFCPLCETFSETGDRLTTRYQLVT